MSPELLHRLSEKSLVAHRPPDNETAWIPCRLDAILRNSRRRGVTILMGASGLGKSVACYKILADHVETGGFGVVLPDSVIASAVTLEQAITASLRQLHPALAAVGDSAASLSSPERELLLIVEDINRSGQARMLLEKIIGWSRAEGVEKSSGSNWRLICPIWPETLALLREQFRKLIEPLLIVAAGFSESEGCQAVLARARLDGRTLSTLSAEAISRALGNDPLLIALHDLETDPISGDVIGQFISSSLERTARENREAPAVTYHDVLLALAREMLTRRQIELDWRRVSTWEGLEGEPLRLLGRIAHRGELIRIEGPLSEQRLLFRHDRVRDWLLATAATELQHRNALPELIVIDPYFAELIGEVLI